MPTNGYQPENNLVQSIILFIIFFGLFLVGIFAFSFLSLSNAIPCAIAIGLCFVALVIPLTWIGRSDSAEP